MKLRLGQASVAVCAAAMLCALTFNAFGQAPPPPRGADAPAAAAPAPEPPGGPPAPAEQGARQLRLDQVIIQTGPASRGRGAPAPTAPQEIVGPSGGPSGAHYGALHGEVPKGITPLKRDLFTSDDFYADRDLWLDKRYYRCGSPLALETYWETSLQVDGKAEKAPGADFPRTAAWGRCDIDYPVEDIVSPYAFGTAQEHYDALMAEAKSRGGPTRYTMADLPNWNGFYTRGGFRGQEPISAVIFRGWYRGEVIQAPTYLSLFTPEYQQRMVQPMYHTAKNNAPEYPGAYCWPEGFMRRWFDPDKSVIMVPQLVQFRSHLSETLMTEVAIDRNFNMDGSVPNLMGDVRQWYGDAVGFWDGDILITWTSNIKSWTAHGWFEWSDELQSIEIYTPITDKEGAFVGINHEAVLYDPQALVKPVRIVENWEKSRELNVGAPFEWRECAQTLFPIKGVQTAVNPGDTIEYTVPDLNNRPWAQLWEEYFEKGMTKPEGPDVLAGFD